MSRREKLLTPVRKALRIVTWPARRFFDPRLAGVVAAVEASNAQLAQQVHSAVELMSFMNRETIRTSDVLARTSNEVARMSDELARLRERLLPLADHVAAEHAMQTGVAGLTRELADFLNFAKSHRGFLAERNLWFNDPLSFRYTEGEVELATVNERIVEVPFAFRALGDLPPGARILDVGSTESTVAVALASLGYRVTAIDLRPYPLMHPNLTAIATPLESAGLSPASFDAALCISSIEHFGLESYGSDAGVPDADREAVSLIRSLLAPGGRLVLTVPFGVASTDAFQRVYDTDRLDSLLGGWRVSVRLVLEQRTPTEWVAIDDPRAATDPDRRYVALVVAVADQHE